MLVSSTTSPERGASPKSLSTLSSAATLGSERIITVAAAATSDGDAATSPPASSWAARRCGSTSKPTTVNPAAMRLALIADPIVPRPTTPTRGSSALGVGDNRVGDRLEIVIVQKRLALQ